MKVVPYLFLEGRCEEALEFYKTALGAETVMMMRYGDAPEPPPPGMVPPGSEHKVMHAEFRIGDSRVMASDGGCGGAEAISEVTLSLTVADAAEADRAFGRLAEGGAVQMPLGPTFFAPRFGKLKDRFGVSWIVVAEG